MAQQAAYQNQAARQGYLNIHNQQMAMQAQWQQRSSISPTPEEKFMELIDGKSDEEIVIAFEILLMDEKKTNDELIRKIKENHEQSQSMKKDNFLSMCKRFRPSINEKLLERVSKLKAFW